MFLPLFSLFFLLSTRLSTPKALSSSHPFLFFLDESVEATKMTKEEQEIDIMRSWVEAGGFPARPEEEAKTVMMEVSPLSCVYHPSA